MKKKTFYNIFTTWLLRILIVVVILSGIILFMLSVLSGTSEAHKNGLQQAFSDYFKADVKFQTLKEFNIIPQLTFEVHELNAKYTDQQDNFTIEKFRIGFDLINLVKGKKEIADVDIQALKFPNAIPKTTINQIKIIDQPQPRLVFSGVYRDISFEGEIAVQLKSLGSINKSYYLLEKNSIIGKFGEFEISGFFTPYNIQRIVFDDLVISQQKEAIAKAKIVGGGVPGILFQLNCTQDKKILLNAPMKDLISDLISKNNLSVQGACP